MFGTDIGPLLATFLLTVPTLLLLFWWSRRNHNYWKDRGIPSATAIPFVGSLYQIAFAPLQDVELERYQKYGRIYGHYEGNNALLSVAEPDLLRNIFVKDFPTFSSRRPFRTGDKVVDKLVSIVNGEDWKRIRTIITPTFTTGKIKRMLSIFKECSRTLVQNFENISRKDQRVDAKRIYGAFTMDIIASSAFSTKLDSYNDPENRFVQAARNAFTRSVSWRFVLFLLAPRIMRLLRIQPFLPSAFNFFKNVTMEIIQERQQKKNGPKRNDFLQLLMDTVEELNEKSEENVEKDNDIAENYGEDGSSLNTFKNISSKTMSTDEVLGQCILFFLAGYDTTASTLSFASYLLALNPEIQEKLRIEVDQVLQEHDGELTYEALQKMKYLDNVISETLRIFPPATRLERVAVEDYKLGDTGITIPKGMIVSIPNYAMHRDPKFWPDPEKFEPDRFTAEERAKRDPYAYLPFGAGPRNCVGMRFALMEVKVCLAHVINHFIIKESPHTKNPLEFYMGQGLLQPKEIVVGFEIRKDAKNVK